MEFSSKLGITFFSCQLASYLLIILILFHLNLQLLVILRFLFLIIILHFLNSYFRYLFFLLVHLIFLLSFLSFWYFLGFNLLSLISQQQLNCLASCVLLTFVPLILIFYCYIFSHTYFNPFLCWDIISISKDTKKLINYQLLTLTYLSVSILTFIVTFIITFLYNKFSLKTIINFYLLIYTKTGDLFFNLLFML